MSLLFYLKINAHEDFFSKYYSLYFKDITYF